MSSAPPSWQDGPAEDGAGGAARRPDSAELSRRAGVRFG
jgi:hypothetical protein